MKRRERKHFRIALIFFLDSAAGYGVWKRARQGGIYTHKEPASTAGLAVLKLAKLTK